MDDATSERGTARDVFGDIYRQHRWLSESRSGPGSTPAAARRYVEVLERVLREENVRSVVDVGCGDWAFSRLVSWQAVRYLGVDVVPDLIAHLERTHASDGVHFACIDASREELPAADLVIAKDILQHWPSAAIERFLRALPRFRLALLTNDRDRVYRTGWRQLWRPRRIDVVNADVAFGGYRPVRLCEPPVSLNARELARFTVNLGSAIRDTKEVLLWRRTG